MSLGTILLIILVLFLIGVLPTWPQSTSCRVLPERRIRVCSNQRRPAVAARKDLGIAY